MLVWLLHGLVYTGIFSYWYRKCWCKTDVRRLTNRIYNSEQCGFSFKIESPHYKLQCTLVQYLLREYTNPKLCWQEMQTLVNVTT